MANMNENEITINLEAKRRNITSILSLNDDCLIEIFRYLDIEKHIELALLCSRFEYAIKLLYKTTKELRMLGPEEFYILEATDLLEKGLPIIGSYIVIANISRCKSIKSVKLTTQYCHNLTSIICNGNKTIVSKFDENIFYKNINITKLQHLVSLQLPMSGIKDDMINIFSQISTIEDLNVSHSRITGVHIEKFINLKKLSLGSCTRIEPNHFINICKKTIKLEELNICYCGRLNTLAFDAMVKNLNELIILTMSFYYTMKELHTISKLEKLSSLSIFGYTENLNAMKNLLKCLVQDKKDKLIALEIQYHSDNIFLFDPIFQFINLKQLSIFSYFSYLKSQDCPDSYKENLLKLKTLKILNVRENSIFGKLDLNFLLNLLQKTTALSFLDFLNRKDVDNKFIFKIIEILSEQNRIKPLTVCVSGTSVSNSIRGHPLVEKGKKLIKITFNQLDYHKLVDSEIKKDILN